MTLIDSLLADSNLRIRILEIEERYLRGRLNEVREELHRYRRRLSKIRIRFTQPCNPGDKHMAPSTGALNLTTAGQTAKASVVGFDQNGQPMPADFVMPAVTFSVDNDAVATASADADGTTSTITAVSDGSAILTAKVTSAEGVELTASADVTVDFTPPPTPVLSSIQIAFDTAPATSAAAAAAADTRSPNEKLAAAVGGTV